MIEPTQLRALGISENEAVILAEIIQNSSCTATELIESTGMNRKVVYDGLKRLAHKALINSLKSGKERKYSFGGEPSIRALIEREKQSMEIRAKEMLAITQAIKKIQVEEPVEVTTFSGTQGVRVTLNKLLELNSDYVAFGGPLESEAIMTETFWLNFQQKQKDMNIKIKLLFNNSLKKWIGKIDNSNINIKFLKEVEPLAETIICKDHVFLIIWTANPSGTIIINKALAKSYTQIFDMLWERASK
ncbi:MAG: helix-turn-helix domain-containing protein [Nanoarchaeota archaeon]